MQGNLRNLKQFKKLRKTLKYIPMVLRKKFVTRKKNVFFK